MKNLDKLLDLIDLALNSKVVTPEDRVIDFDRNSTRRYPDEDISEALTVVITLIKQGHISWLDNVEELRELCISLYTSPSNTLAESDASGSLASYVQQMGVKVSPPKPVHTDLSLRLPAIPYDPPSAYAVAKAEGRVVKLHRVIDMLLEGFDRPDGFLNNHDKLHAKLDKYRAELHEAEKDLHRMMGRQ